MGLNLICPNCGKRMTMNFSTGKVLCQHCGYVRPDEIGRIEEAGKTVQAHGQRRAVHLTYRGEVEAGAQAAFTTGHELLHEGKRDEALKAFYRSAAEQPDFIDAHLWIAELSLDEKTKRDHLAIVLGYDPSNLAAQGQLIILNKKGVTETPVQPFEDAFQDPEPLSVSPPPQRTTQTTQFTCPQCGGKLNFLEREQIVSCDTCGYRASRTGQIVQIGQTTRILPSEPSATIKLTVDPATIALIERKFKPVIWNIGPRLIKCRQCGAEHTIPTGKLSPQCRFCGATALGLVDTPRSFDQPDGLIPFAFDETAATTLIDKQLGNIGEQVTQLLKTGKLQRSELQGAYLPYWLFDVKVKVDALNTQPLRQTGSLAATETVRDIGVCAIKSPPPTLTAYLEPYRMTAVIPFQPKWLTQYPAQLYAADFDQASLEARASALRFIQRKNDPNAGQSTAQTLSLARNAGRVQGMSCRLLLLPVYITVLNEQKGEVSLALVNGQTGKVVIGRIEHSRTR